MSSMNDNEDVIMLDVGGHKFKTLRSTLCKESSQLEAMFSGRHAHPARRQEDGSFFIDRDGTHFQHILNYLRVGYTVSLPSDEDSKEALAVEADYYGLDELLRVLRLPTSIDVDKILSQEALAIRKEEDTIRAVFLNGSAESLHPFHGLVPLFPTRNTVATKSPVSVSLPIAYEPVEDRRDALMDYFGKDDSPAGTPVTVEKLSKFRNNFSEEHPNILLRLSDILESERVIIAGGSVLRALTNGPNLRTATFWAADDANLADVDIFLYCENRDEANRVARDIFCALAVDGERWMIQRSTGVITMHKYADEYSRYGPSIVQEVQIILRLYDSPTEVLFGFDCDSCCCAYDGRTVWATPRCLAALRTGVNILNPLHSWPKKASYERRLAKYARRGFPVQVPGLSRKHIDHGRLQRAPMRNIHGMARLVLLDTDMNPRVRPDQMRAMGGYCDESRCLFPSVYRERFEGDRRAILEDVAEELGVPENAVSYADLYDFQHIRASNFSRDAAWVEIAGAATLNRPHKRFDHLVDSWQTEKKSREYVNLRDITKYDLDNIYYGHAYIQDDDAGGEQGDDVTMEDA